MLKAVNIKYMKSVRYVRKAVYNRKMCLFFIISSIYHCQFCRICWCCDNNVTELPPEFNVSWNY